jgi:hypothetical protein
MSGERREREQTKEWMKPAFMIVDMLLYFEKRSNVPLLSEIF